MTVLHLTAKIEIIGVNPYVLITSEQAERLQPDWKKPMPVLIRVNHQPSTPWSINMMPVGNGSFYLYLHGDVRRASGTMVGDRVAIEVSFDPDYRGGPPSILPEWFTVALESSEAARSHWDQLSPSRQKEVIRYLVNLKSQEARDRNLNKAIQILSGESGRFIGRDWRDGK